ncbi:hypothetical protein SmJEL517_g02926 [Synchytrium microbalum]|uniref:Cytochrome b5 heme-binding domain-containing protein n=1 Tax=Synchytrium microbalum TaxID=1806994 RepID=A0A507C571_9FUNG|nr:uncharacterized protein SmJEL517_g02926 [Synchytrium microbalum]TPX34528.1 hypothetical protein SmJEL517_g02926 [Synchytrium microbalum]
MANLVPSNGIKFKVDVVARHNTEDDCWVVIDGKVYDVTDYLESHPGGKRILMSVAGKDATAQFANFHNVPNILANYAKKLYIGDLDQEHKEPPKYQGDLFGNLLPYSEPNWYHSWKSPYYNDSHKKLREFMRNWVDTELMPYIEEWDKAEQIPKSMIKRFGEVGILAAFLDYGKWRGNEFGIPPPGGITESEWDAFHGLILRDELGRIASAGVKWAMVTGPALALPTILNFGTKEMQQRIIGPVVRGDKVICLAMTEPYSGSDVAAFQTVGVKQPDGGWLVSGEKKFITTGVWADYFVIAVKTDPKAGASGMSLLLGERGFPGLKTRGFKVQGWAGSGTAYVTMENMKIPPQNLIGKEGNGFRQLMHNLNLERLQGQAGGVRSCRVLLEEAMKHALTRKTFGQFLIERK